MPQLTTRPPTCVVPWPLILVEGGEKTGKSWLIAQLSASPRVGRTYWLDIGEGSADEYGDAITGAQTYEVVVHDGSWASIFGQIEAAHAEAKRARAAGEPPVVLGIDSMTLLWEMLKDWAGSRARESESNKRRLARDPSAEIKVPSHIWNDVHARWRRMMRLLMTFEGIAVVTARGKDVIKIGEDGKPVEGERDYKVEAERNLRFDATVWLQLSHHAPPTIVGARSKHLRIRYGKDDAKLLPPDSTLEQLVFEGLRCSVDSQPRDLVPLGRERLPEQIAADALATTDRDALLDLLAEASHPQYAGASVEYDGAEVLLTDLITRRGKQVTGGPAPRRDGPPQQGNRFARHKAEQAAQTVPPAPPEAGQSPDDPADAELLGRLGQALAACGSASAPAQVAVANAMTGRKIKDLSELTRADAVRIGKAAASAAKQQNPRAALAALVGQALKNRQAKTTGKAA